MIQNTVLTTSASNIAVGSGTIGTATSTIYFCNRTGTPTTFNLYAVPAGGVAGQDNIVYSNKVVAGNDTYIADLEKIYLSNGDTLQANANVGSAIVATVSSIGV